MKKEGKKLTLNDFKVRVDGQTTNEKLSSISGGILGSCHCVTVCSGNGVKGNSVYNCCFTTCN